MKNSAILFVAVLFVACTPKPTPLQIDLDTQSNKLETFAPDVVSSQMDERDFALSPNRDEIVFTRGSYDQSIRVLVSVKKTEEGWSEPELLPFSGEYQDIEPFFSTGGDSLFFASKRPVFQDTTRADYNIWYATKTESGWGEPFALDSIINTPKDEFFPSVTSNGNLYFTAIYENGVGSEDIFFSKNENGSYLPPEPLDTMINGKGYEFNAWVSPQEDMIIFSSYGRPDGFGGGDLYMSKKDAAGNWIPAKNLGPEINTKTLDFCPFYDQKTKQLYFTSKRRMNPVSQLNSIDAFNKESEKVDNGLGNIYRIHVGSFDFLAD